MAIPHSTMMRRTLQYAMLRLQSVGHGRIGIELLLGHQQVTGEWKGVGGMFSRMYLPCILQHILSFLSNTVEQIQPVNGLTRPVQIVKQCGFTGPFS